MSGRATFGGSAGGGKSSSNLKFHRQEPSFLRKMKEQVGYREHKHQLQDKVSVYNDVFLGRHVIITLLLSVFR